LSDQSDVVIDYSGLVRNMRKKDFKKKFSITGDGNASTYSSAASSSLSSFSGGSESTWSIPRTRRGRPTLTSEGIRRLGSSFRVSLRPMRYNRSRRGGGGGDASSHIGGLSVSDDNGRRGSFLTFLKQLVYPLLVIGAIVASHHMYFSNYSPSLLKHYKEKTPSFYENVFAGKQHFMQKETAAALRGSTLDITKDIFTDADNVTTGDDVTQTGYVTEYGHVTKYGFVSKNATAAEDASAAPVRKDWGPALRDYLTKNTTTITVAYIVPVYSCYKLREQKKNYGLTDPNDDREFQDSAVMLQASIHRNSVRSPESGSKFDYEMVALVHRNVESCAGGANRSAILENLGYRVEVVREPIHVRNVKNEFLQKNAPKNIDARLGMREMIRLFAFKMVEYRITVLVEPTTWLMRPPDGIYDALLNGVNGNAWAEAHPKHIVRDTFYPNGTILTDKALPKEVDIMFSRDYSALSPKTWTTGLSLSFVIIKPNIKLFRKLIGIYQNTNYDPIHGWDAKGYAHYTGSMQTKGLLTYFFSEIQPHRKLELYRCLYNNLADIPFVADKSGSRDNCRDVKEHKTLPDGSPMPCTDCRLQMMDEIVVANFAICQAPWVCPYMKLVRVPLLRPTIEMCHRLHENWFALRETVEEHNIPSERTPTTGRFHPEIFHGYCQPGLAGGGAYMSMNRAN